MNLYLVSNQHLKRGEIETQPRWKINNASHSFNLWQLRTFCLTQLDNRIDSEGDSLEDKILNLSQVNQITKENLPYVVIDSPAWVAGDEFLVFRLFQNHQHHTHFRMPRPLIEIHSRKGRIPKHDLIRLGFFYLSDGETLPLSFGGGLG